MTTDAGAAGPALDDQDLARLENVLEETGADLVGSLSAELIAGGRSNLTYRLTDGAASWVLRTPPRVGRTPSAHDVLREFKVTSALFSSGVAVPRPIASSEKYDVLGLPFAISDFVHGRTVQSQADLDRIPDGVLDRVNTRLVESLAALHAVDHRAAGLEDFGRPDGYFERQLRRWSGQWEIVGDRRLDVLANDVMARLQGETPAQCHASVVHGDYRIDNTLLDLDGPEPRVAAIVDWELSTIGDPVADVATMAAYHHEAFDLVVGAASAWTSARVPDADGLAALYERFGGRLGPSWAAHLRLAHFKIAVIAAGIDHRARAGGLTGPGFDTSGDAVEPFLSAALTI